MDSLGLENLYVGKHQKSPDLAFPILGYRSWHFQKGNLYSSASETVWQKHMKAQCQTELAHKLVEKNLGQHLAPQHNCSCGLYGFFDLTQLLPLDVVGICEYYGLAELHEKGIRSQYADIKALCLPQVSWFEKTRYYWQIGIFFSINILYVVCFVWSFWLLSDLYVALSYLFCALIFVANYNLSFLKQIKTKTGYFQKQKSLKKWCETNNVLFFDSLEALNKYEKSHL